MEKDVNDKTPKHEQNRAMHCLEMLPLLNWQMSEYFVQKLAFFINYDARVGLEKEPPR